MRQVVRGMECALDDLHTAKDWFSSTLHGYRVWTGSPSRLWGPITWTQDQIPGLRRRLAMAEALESSRPEWPVGTAVIDEDLLSQVAPETAVTNGREAAERLRDCDGVPDEDLIALIEANQDDPYFASGFAGELSPDELAELTVALSYHRTQYDNVHTAEEIDAANAWYGRLVTAMSATLGTATRATGDLALPAGYADGWVEAITEEVPYQIGADPDASGFADRANALGVLLMSGTFSEDFTTTVATGVYDYEREFGAENGAVWGPRSSDAASAFFVADATGARFRDPMVGVLAALGHNPAAAQEFFAGGDQVTVTIAGSDQVVSDRLAYLITERTWAGLPDNGDALGAALEAATTTYRNNQESGRVSADLAGQTLALIGETTGDGAGGWGPWKDAGWQMWDGMRPHIADVLASYGTDVYRVALEGDDLSGGLAGPGSGYLFPDGSAYGVRMDQGLLAKVLGTLGEDEATITPVMAGLMQAGTVAVDYGFSTAAETQESAAGAMLAGLSVDDATSSVVNTSEALAWVMQNAYSGDQSDADLKAERAAAVAEALSLASSLPFIPEVKNEWVQLALGEAESRAFSAVEDGLAGDDDPQAAYAAWDDYARSNLLHQTLDSAVRAGYFTEDSLASAQELYHVTVEPPPASGVITDAQGNPVGLDYSDPAVRSWLNGSGFVAAMKDSVVGPIAAAWAGPGS
ncbi:DUF6571 family protein [Actinotalea sp. M2MS4P-6]|uniref:DUF6571 family protein n=1 Tax=Actinotalea sp. M2MS4P-6 TaxID=2983762 RepID=UPI0029622147|nr:DUF6571 family protein [Actinotalea sp. M2MS4P-6]